MAGEADVELTCITFTYQGGGIIYELPIKKEPYPVDQHTKLKGLGRLKTTTGVQGQLCFSITMRDFFFNSALAIELQGKEDGCEKCAHTQCITVYIGIYDQPPSQSSRSLNPKVVAKMSELLLVLTTRWSLIPMQTVLRWV